jgi:hypothetical protein
MSEQTRNVSGAVAVISPGTQGSGGSLFALLA